MEKELTYNTVIVGAGVSGLYAALKLPKEQNILLICKEDLPSCDSMLAQGGICVQRDETDYDSFFEDTLKAGHYENRKESVDIMIRNSRAVINDLLALGVRFDKEADGSLKYTREGAHAKPRICFHKDITGKEITETLLRNVQALPNVTIMDYTVMEDLLVEGNTCHGIVAKAENGDILRIHAENTILATGGIGGLYEHSTNFPSLTGDALRLAEKYGVELENMDYVQIHPTSLYSEKPGRHFLISESARGLRVQFCSTARANALSMSFCPETRFLLPTCRNGKEGTKHVWLSFAPVPAEDIENHFPNIYKTCLEAGYDIKKEPAPVVPAQHYFMGGIHVDRHSKTTMEHLYAIGETSCNGVHGKNRLASNSLLESLVFAEKAAQHIAGKEGLE